MLKSSILKSLQQSNISSFTLHRKFSSSTPTPTQSQTTEDDYDGKEIKSFDDVLKKYVPEKIYNDISKIYYGKLPEELPISNESKQLSITHDFDIKAYKISCLKEDKRDSRTVRIGAIQTFYPSNTTDNVNKQIKTNFNKYEHIIKAAYHAGVNVLGLQETWTAPFFFCTRENYPWIEFAESAKNGESTLFLKELAKKYNMVIVSPILERDDTKETIWNTAVIIDNHGDVIGKHRKMHIPRVGDFNESSYYMEGDLGCSVFDTDYGKIGVNICYGRHHPLHWLAYGLNRAEIVFNPSATINSLSECMWPIEARCAAIANSYYSVGINRVGTETFHNEFTSGNGLPAHKDFGHFYGSSYVTSPDGSRTPGLSRTRDGLLVTEVDLNLCRQVKDIWKFPMTGRHSYYSELLNEYVKQDFKPDIIKKNEKI